MRGVADKTDVTEELVRLSSHFSQLDTMLAETAPVGVSLISSCRSSTAR